jgi:hypothetical protein
MRSKGLFLWLALGPAACSQNGGFLPGPAALLEVISGDGQSGAVGATLPGPLVVSILDAARHPVPQVFVDFTVAGGGGTVTPPTTRTDFSGRAQAILTLPTTPATIVVEARSAGLTGSPARFSAVAVSGPPRSIAAVSGDRQQGTVGLPLGASFAVRIADGYGNPVAGTPVSFVVVRGAGSLSAERPQSGADGTASSILTLGAPAGEVTVEARSEGLLGSPVTFRATALAGPAHSLSVVSGDGQTGVVGATLQRPFVVSARDAYGNAARGVPLSFALVSGTGTLSTTSTSTDVAGRAETTLTFGREPGERTLQVMAQGLAPVLFRAEALGQVALGYVETLHNGMSLSDVNLQGMDILVHGFVAPDADGRIYESSNFTTYRQAGLVQLAHAAGKKILMSVGGATLSGALSAVAADSVKRGAMVTYLRARVQEWGYDGVDVDWEFPQNDADRSSFTLLMEELHQAVKSADASSLVMFGISTGYYLDYYDFAALDRVSDLALYFGYDWDNPANGPMRNTGTLTTKAGSSIESSAKGALEFILARGYPAQKLLLGMPFYSSAPTSYWYEVRAAWSSQVASSGPFVPDATYLEVFLDGKWWTTPEAITKKMDAVLEGRTSVLDGGTVLRGVGVWELGYEGGYGDLSTAVRAWLSGD